MKPTRATLSLAALEERSLMTVNPFGPAAGHNAFILGDMHSAYSETQGRLAIGGDAYLNAYSVGANTPAKIELQVAGALNFSGGLVDGGSIVHGGALTARYMTTNGGVIQQGPTGIDFAAAMARLAESSDALAASPASSPTAKISGGMFLTGVSGVNYFNVDATDLETVWGVIVDAPADATVIINISGLEARLEYMGFALTGGVTPNHVLFNFHEAQSIVMDGVSLPGGVLAPHAALRFDNGQIVGNAVAWTMTGNGHFNGVASDIALPDPTYTLSGTVYADTNADGLRGLDEPAVTDPVHLILTAADNSPVAEITLAAGGAFAIPALLPGTYTLTATAVDGLGTLPAPMAVTVTGDTANIDIGYVAASDPVETFSLSGTVYEDVNANGERDPGEDAATHPVLLQLIDANGDVVDEITLETGGPYTFTGLVPGIYEMAGAVLDDAGDLLESAYLYGPADINLTADAVDFDFGFIIEAAPVETGAISGRIYQDVNRNDVFDTGDAPLPLTITLTGWDASGAGVGRETTAAADGSYRFEGLPAGRYSLIVGIAGRSETVVGSIGESGGRYDATTGGIVGIELGEGVAAGQYDFGLQPAYSRIRIRYQV